MAEDNWGNLVAVLPWGDNHTAGGGIYYHADCESDEEQQHQADCLDVGDPRSYKWLNTVPLAKSMLHFRTRNDADSSVGTNGYGPALPDYRIMDSQRR